MRDSAGVTCSDCNTKDHYWKKHKWQYECKSCGKRTTLRSGTAMHGSRLTFRHWFIAMHLLTSTKKSFSAPELQRQLGHNRYEPVWSMLHKLRKVMGKRDEEYELSGLIEWDDGFFYTIKPEDEKGMHLKRGKGSQKKSKVLLMVESAPVEGEITRNGKQRNLGHIKMVVIEDLEVSKITPIIGDTLEINCLIGC